MPHNQQIRDAIQSNDSETLKTLLYNLDSDIDDINALDDNNDSYFHIAVKRLFTSTEPSDLYILELLLENGINPTLRNKQDKTALELYDLNVLDFEHRCPALLRTIQIPLPRLFDLLLRSGADVNKKAAYGMSPVCAAASTPANPGRLQALINAGADIFLGYSLSTASFNPLAIALVTYDELVQYNKTNQDLNECIAILLDNHAGIGFSFSSYWKSLKTLDFTHKILLGAEIASHTLSGNTTINHAIRTIKDLEVYCNSKNLNINDELRKIKLSCMKIREACINKDQQMFERVNKVINDIDNQLLQSQSAQPLKENKHDDSGSSQSNKPGFFDKFKGIFSSSAPAATQTNNQSNPISSGSKPKRPS